MKSSRSLISGLIVLAVFFLAIQPELFTYHAGAPSNIANGGYTGGTMESGRLCTACHAGTAQYRDQLISSNVPADGYIPGVSYSITVHIHEPGITRFGFEASPQDNTGAAAGTLTPLDLNTQLSTNTNYITHTALSIDQVDSNTWTFDWMAPIPSGTGRVDFFVAVNVTNHDGTNNGDQIYFDTVSIQEKVAIGINNPVLTLDEIAVYPGITSDFVYINTQVQNTELLGGLYNLNGQKVLPDHPLSYTQNKLDLSNLPAGVYLLDLRLKNTHRTIKLLKR